MQAIIKSKHERFLEMITEVKATHLNPDKYLLKLERDLELSYENYVRKIEDIKIAIIEYRLSEKMLRSRLRDLILKKQTVASVI